VTRDLLTPRAEQDFRDIARWPRKHRGTEAARKAIRNIREQLDQLGRHPDFRPRFRVLSAPYLHCHSRPPIGSRASVTALVSLRSPMRWVLDKREYRFALLGDTRREETPRRASIADRRDRTGDVVSTVIAW
jgi:plasmid stabilization system protein ParE